MRTIGPSEHDEQRSLIEWAKLMESRTPELRLLFAIPNGANKSPAAARRFKKEGLRSGVPDLCLPIARGSYHGLFLEMKREAAPPSTVTPAQLAWRNALREQGYRAEIAFGALDGIRVIQQYLGE